MAPGLIPGQRREGGRFADLVVFSTDIECSRMIGQCWRYLKLGYN